MFPVSCMRFYVTAWFA